MAKGYMRKDGAKGKTRTSANSYADHYGIDRKKEPLEYHHTRELDRRGYSVNHYLDTSTNKGGKTVALTSTHDNGILHSSMDETGKISHYNEHYS